MRQGEAALEGRPLLDHGPASLPDALPLPWLDIEGARDRARAAARAIAHAMRPCLLANHYPVLHGLRSLAILSVLSVHVAIGFRAVGLLPGSRAPAYFQGIFFGMDLFFILSGFLIGTMLLKSKEEGLMGIGRFYLRRSLRIFPLYYVVLTLLALAAPAGSVDPLGLAREYLYVANYGEITPHTRVMLWGWSLCVEEHFYLAIPVFFTLLGVIKSPGARIALLAAVWAAGLAVRLGIYFGGGAHFSAAELHDAIYLKTHARFDVLAAGVLLAYVHHHFREPIRAFLERPLVRALTWAWVLACLTLLLVRPELFGSVALFKILAWGTITSLMYVPLILLLLTGDGTATRLLSLRPFLWFATFGYGIYLVHIPILWVIFPYARAAVERLGLPGAWVWASLFVALVACSTALAYVLHMIVEKPVIALRERLAR